MGSKVDSYIASTFFQQLVECAKIFSAYSIGMRKHFHDNNVVITLVEISFSSKSPEFCKEILKVCSIYERSVWQY